MTAALEIARAALAHVDGDGEVVVHAETSGLARFAESKVHQPTLIDDVVVRVRSIHDGKVGAATTNRTDDSGLAEVARRAAAAANGAPPDPNFPGLAPPSELPRVDGFDATTAALGADEQARLAEDAIAAAGLPAYGFFTSGLVELAIASSTGLAAEQRATDASVLVLAADEHRSGYAEATAWRAADIDVAAVAREATAKALRTERAQTVEPAAYPAVLEPYAFAELLQSFAHDSLGALGLLERRGFFAGKIGERVFDEKITIVDDGLDRRGLPKAFDFEGSPKGRVDLVADGIARGVVWDRRTASRAGNGAETTAHAPPPDFLDWGPLPTALSVMGGDAASVDELVSLVGDGLYITRLHYLGVVHPREGVITGMTRDGTFRIRDGKIAEPLVNLRFTVSFPELLREVPGLTHEVKLVNATSFYGERYAHGSLVPALATARFNVTGVGSTPGI